MLLVSQIKSDTSFASWLNHKHVDNGYTKDTFKNSNGNYNSMLILLIITWALVDYFELGVNWKVASHAYGLLILVLLIQDIFIIKPQQHIPNSITTLNTMIRGSSLSSSISTRSKTSNCDIHFEKSNEDASRREEKEYPSSKFINGTKQNSNLLLQESNDTSIRTDKIINPQHSKSDKLGSQLLLERQKHLGPNVSCFYADKGGLIITRGKGCYLIDIDGNEYLDCCNNVACVGHAEHRVVNAGMKELQNIQTNGRFLHPAQQRYIKKLLATFPTELNTIYLVNSGSEANDLALRIAKAHAEKKGVASRPDDVICLDSAYHGHTEALIGISPYKWYQSIDGKNYRASTTHVAALPDTFRGKYRSSAGCGQKYAQDVCNLIKETGGIGVYIAESIVGCGGQIMLPPEYLKNCYKAVREAGGVCIADEVQTGFARSGTNFWQFQNYDVVPDIVTFGKPMGNGYPVAGVVCRREVADSFASSGIEYFNTYGGNSVACCIAEAVLDVIEEDNLMHHSSIVGNYLLDKLCELQLDFDYWIGDVRGQGLFLGVEFVRMDNDEFIPLAGLCKFVVDYLMQDRVIVSRDGPDYNVIKIKPPLVFGKKEADLLISSMRSALECAKSENKF